jgi:hypothetical protein
MFISVLYIILVWYEHFIQLLCHYRSCLDQKTDVVNFQFLNTNRFAVDDSLNSDKDLQAFALDDVFFLFESIIFPRNV